MADPKQTQMQTQARKGRKVISMRCEAGIQLGARVVETVVAEKHAVEMELHPAGVLVAYAGRQMLVPYAQVRHAELAPEE